MEHRQLWQLRCVFPAVVGLSSPGSNTQSVTLSVTGMHCIFNIMLWTIKGNISLILIGVTRVKAKFTELMLFLILFLCLYSKPFNFSSLYYNWGKRPIF